MARGLFLVCHVSRRTRTRSVGERLRTLDVSSGPSLAGRRRKARALTAKHTLAQSVRQKQMLSEQQKATRRVIFCRCRAWAGGGWRK